MKRHKTQRGFTLTELLVVIAIVAILLGIGVPSYRYVTNANRAAAEINGLLGDLMYARVDAVRQGIPVMVCTSSDGKTCSNSTSWEAGWIVCVPNPAVVPSNCDNTSTLLRVQTPFTSTDTLRPDTTSSAYAVTFNRVGFATGLGATGAVLTLHDSSSNSAWTRCLTVSIVGMLSVTNHVNNAACQ